MKFDWLWRIAKAFFDAVFCTIGKTKFSHIPYNTDFQNGDNLDVLNFFCIMGKMKFLKENFRTMNKWSFSKGEYLYYEL